MRRTTAAVFGTLSGTALLLAAKFGADAAAAGQGAAGADQAAAQAGGQLAPGGAVPAAPGGGQSSTNPGRAGAGGAGAGAGAGAGRAGGAAANGLKNGLFRGNASVNQYGPIQVTIRVANGRITGVAATHAQSPARTVQVNRRAIPLLRQETLKAQSAQINAVSGATYTSRSFAASLQSALAAARA